MASARLPFCYQSKTRDLIKLRATKFKGNSNIYMPKGLPPDCEVDLLLRKEAYQKTFKTYMKSNCNSNGEQESNITPDQQKGFQES